jgi:predicted ABC-type ATPase
VAARPRIYVLAGVNGAGKSSVGGATIRRFGGEYFDPDEAARQILKANPGLTQSDANSVAWHHGRRLLENAVAHRLDFVVETTLGGSTIARLLAAAAHDGIEIHVWYAGLATADLHIERVRARVRRGGHDIPEADIRRRHRHSRLNLIALLPLLTSLRVYDNSAEADPAAGVAPTPLLVLELQGAVIMNAADLARTPEWAKPIVAAALKAARAATSPGPSAG